MAWDTDALLVLCALNSASTPLAVSTDTIQRPIVDVVTGFVRLHRAFSPLEGYLLGFWLMIDNASEWTLGIVVVLPLAP